MLNHSFILCKIRTVSSLACKVFAFKVWSLHKLDTSWFKAHIDSKRSNGGLVIKLQFRLSCSDIVPPQKSEEDSPDLREGKPLSDAEAWSTAKSKKSGRLAFPPIRETIWVVFCGILRTPNLRILMDREHVRDNISSCGEEVAPHATRAHGTPADYMRSNGVATEGLGDNIVKIFHASQVIASFFQMRRIVTILVKTVDLQLKESFVKLDTKGLTLVHNNKY